MTAQRVVGIAGTGRMGLAIAERLLDCGIPLRVWNRTAARSQPLLARGASFADNPRELVASCEVVITSLLNDGAIEAVYLGDCGLLSGAVRDRLFIDTSTVQPRTVLQVASQASARGCAFVDAPVLGTVAPAREGKLIVLAGGSSSDVERATATLRHISRVIHHLGKVGSGAAMKLAVNVPLVAYWAAMADSFSVAKAHGLDPTSLIDIIADSPAALAQLAIKLPILRGDSDSVGVSVDAVLTLCSIMKADASACSLDLPSIEAARMVFQVVSNGGWGGRDVAAAPRFKLHKESA